ncbi:hypothetical protein DAI22_12g033901 [Oryza sativa Japonica Group]|nr:hypothetical protein DAI22_12g033901 [Oryza sativa Japonica Group]
MLHKTEVQAENHRSKHPPILLCCILIISNSFICFWCCRLWPVTHTSLFYHIFSCSCIASCLVVDIGNCS